MESFRSAASAQRSGVQVHVRIDLVYTLAVFSVEREWDPKAVRAATVQKVTITPRN